MHLAESVELCRVFVVCFRFHCDCAQEVRQQVAAVTRAEIPTHYNDVEIIHDARWKEEDSLTQVPVFTASTQCERAYSCSRA